MDETDVHNERAKMGLLCYKGSFAYDLNVK